ncbi:CHRD domain-containing protein [Pseudoduganella plicata]|uniref:CHRD domain-containing protein n=2 Tax=Pseudoduganella plicata TaxID=321984 RepID=A0AA87Y0Q2_9BURK|nr:CHRD domain-containing protein [Pseudoduganella plicata]GGY79359.1 CHRD domain-containing protein [Pseudoduganella plicata]
MTTALPKFLTALAFALCSLSASATVMIASSNTYTTALSGTAEAPPNESPGTGTATVGFDIDTHTLVIDVTFSGLIGMTTAAHIHCCTAIPGEGTAGVATQVPNFVDFPLGVTAGVYSHVFDTSLAGTWNQAFINAHGGTTAGAEAALLAGLDSGSAYFNIHSTAAPGGEIRGFLQPVPEPATVAMLALGAPLMLALARRRKRHC